jgi:Protein of unknown function (DUF2905)
MNGWAPMQFGKLLVVAGIFMVALGLLVMLGSKVSFFGLGRLPGDIAYKGKHTTFYFPIVTCAVLSLMITLIFWLVKVLTRR